MAHATAKFRVDPLLVKVLSETYRSTEKALKELVDNAWDADATAVHIELPAPMTGDSIVISDDGSGMTPTEIESEYMVVADDRKSRRGDRTQKFKRRVKGRKGVGKFAGLMAADVMTVVTTARGSRTQLTIPKDALKPRDRDLPMVSLPIEVSEVPHIDHGTKISLSHLNQTFAYPDADKLRQLLFLEYGRSENFAIYVNGDRLDMGDLPGKAHEHRAELPTVGPVYLRYTVGDGTKGFKGSGVSIRVDGKTVGDPYFFGLEQDKDVPTKLLKLVYGEVEADGLLESVTADGGAIVENSAAFMVLRTWVGERIKEALREVHKRAMHMAKMRNQKAIEAALGKIPEHRRPIAERCLHRVLEKFYDEPAQKFKAIVKVCLDAMEFSDYFTVIAAIEKAEKTDVATFAAALQEFGLTDMSCMMRQATYRMKFLDFLDRLVSDSKTTEKELHQAIAGSLWVLGPEYEFMSSNRTLETMLRDHLDTKYSGSRAKNRPDLFLAERLAGGHLLIEFKRPAKYIDRKDEAQAFEYRDELKRRFPDISIMMIGKGRAPSVDGNDADRNLRIVSYAGLISTARTRLEWLLRDLTASRRPAASPTAALA